VVSSADIVLGGGKDAILAVIKVAAVVVVAVLVIASVVVVALESCKYILHLVKIVI